MSKSGRDYKEQTQERRRVRAAKHGDGTSGRDGKLIEGVIDYEVEDRQIIGGRRNGDHRDHARSRRAA